MSQLLALFFFLFLLQNPLWANQEPVLITDSLSAEEAMQTADSILKRRKFEESASIYLSLATYFEEQKNWSRYIEISTRLAVSWQGQQEYAKAQAHLAELIKVAEEKLPGTHPNLAYAYRQQGVSNYYLRHFKMALSFFEKALAIRKKIFDRQHPDIIKGYFNIGDCYQMIYQFDKAILYLDTSLHLQTDPPTSIIHSTYRVLARTYALQGNMEKAKTYQDAYFEICNKLFAKQAWKLADARATMGAFFARWELADETIFYSNQALDIYEKMEDKWKSDSMGMANCFHNIALAYELKKELDTALHYYDKSYQLNRQCLGENHIAVASNYNNMGMVSFQKKDYQKALIFYEKAKRINLALGKTARASVNYNNLGNTWLELKNYQQALENNQLAIQSVLPEYQNKNAYENPNISNTLVNDKMRLLAYLSSKASTFFQWYLKEQKAKDLDASLQTYETAIQLTDHIRKSYQMDASQSFLLEQTKPLFEEAIWACYKKYEDSGEEKYWRKAFEYSEKSKAIILLRAVKDVNARNFAGVDETSLERERKLKTSIDSLEILMEKPANRTAGLSDSLVRFNRAHEDLIAFFEKENPSYFNLKYDQTPLSIEDIQQQLLSDTNKNMIEYFVGEKHLFTFVITPDHFYMLSQSLEKVPLAQWVDSLRYGIYYCATADSLPPLSICKSLDKQYLEKAWLFYQLLIEPVKKITSSSAWVIIPDGELGYLPFDALLSEKEDTTAAWYVEQYWHKPKYLALDYQFSYCYSATLLKELMERKNEKASNRILAFAPFFERSSRGESRRLDYTEKEVAAILSYFSGDSYVKDQATRQNFWNYAADYSYIHIASHAHTNEENPKLSCISFSQTFPDSIDEKELLYVWQLYNLPLKASMIVLSACETGIGKLLQGEGIISLARAFFYGGTKSIVTSLWRVNDRATSGLMVRFYHYLKEGKTKDAALALAKLEHIEKGFKAKPYHWAGFVPIGNMESVKIRQPLKKIWMLGLGGLALLGLFLFYRKQSPKIS